MAKRWLLLLCLVAVLAHTSNAAATRGLIKRRRWPAGSKRSSSPKPKPIQVEEIDPLKITPSEHRPEPGQLNLELIDNRLTPPNYCYYTVNGNLTQPAVSKPKGGPSLQLSKEIATLLAEPRPCMYYLKECNQNLTENVDLKGNCCYGDRCGASALLFPAWALVISDPVLMQSSLWSRLPAFLRLVRLDTRLLPGHGSLCSRCHVALSDVAAVFLTAAQCKAAPPVSLPGYPSYAL